MPAAIHRFAVILSSHAIKGIINLKLWGNAAWAICVGSVRAPQRYINFCRSQRRAEHSPVRLRDKTMPKGQGSERQQTPQPLQGAPSEGLKGACGWI
jgi:hypothetical protein